MPKPPIYLGVCSDRRGRDKYWWEFLNCGILGETHSLTSALRGARHHARDYGVELIIADEVSRREAVAEEAR